MVIQTRAQAQQGEGTSGDQGEESNLILNVLNQLKESMQALNARMENIERRQEEGRDHDNPPPMREHRIERREIPQQRDGVEDGKLRHDIPEFLGSSNPEEFLEWMDKVDLIFQLHNYTPEYQVKVLVASFRGHALTWWKDMSRRRERGGELPIASWMHLKNVMKASFVPKSHTTFLRKELQSIKQGGQPVADYYYEMKRLMARLGIDEEEEETEARFVGGLDRPLRHKVELESFRASSLEEVFKYALTIEQQLKEDDQFRGKFKYPVPGAKPIPATPSTPSATSGSPGAPRQDLPGSSSGSQPTQTPSRNTPIRTGNPYPGSSPSGSHNAPNRPTTRHNQCYKCK